MVYNTYHKRKECPVKRFLASLVLVLLLIPVVTLAQETEQETGPTDEILQNTVAERVDLRAQRRAEFSAARGERIAARCDALKTKIDQLSGRIDTIKNARGRLVSARVEKLETLIERLNDQGVDTAALSEDVAKLKTLSGELDGLWDTYQAAKVALKEARCSGDAAEDFHEALEAAKAAMADLRSKYQEIKDLFTNEIKPALAEIRQQLADQAATDNRE